MSVFTPGLRLRSRYLLRERLGAGGMSEVWRATDEVLDRPVAVKVLAPGLGGDPALREAIWHEARAVARLNHPHVAAVHDYGEVSLASGDPAGYLVMELVEGSSLAEVLRRGPLPWPRAAALVSQVGSALAAAHRIGVVHRDIKPGNVMLTPTGAKVLDFGIAAVVGRTGEAERLVGTPGYVAPERFDRTAPVQPASDVYSLGMLLHEAVLGRPPWWPENWREATRLARDGRTPVADQPGVPPALTALCRQCLVADPGQRPSAEVVSRTLAGLAERVRSTDDDQTVLDAAAPGAAPPTQVLPVRYAVGAAGLPGPAPLPPTRVAETEPVVAGVPGGAGGRRRVWPFAALAGVVLVGVMATALGLGPRLFDDTPSGPANAGAGRPTTGVVTAPATVPATPPAAGADRDRAAEAAVLAELERVIVDGFAAGAITVDGRDDLLDELADLRREAERPGRRPGQLRREAERMREDVEDLRADGEITPAVAAELIGLLGQLRDDG